jgi:hypothetical protein
MYMSYMNACWVIWMAKLGVGLSGLVYLCATPHTYIISSYNLAKNYMAGGTLGRPLSILLSYTRPIEGFILFYLGCIMYGALIQMPIAI